MAKCKRNLPKGWREIRWKEKDGKQFSAVVPKQITKDVAKRLTNNQIMFVENNRKLKRGTFIICK